MRSRNKFNVADLTSPDKSQIVRFMWHSDEHTVLVTTRGDERRTRFTRENARKTWRRFREAGFVPTDDTPFGCDGRFCSTGKCDHSYESLVRTSPEKFENELEAEMEGGAF